MDSKRYNFILWGTSSFLWIASRIVATCLYFVQYKQVTAFLQMNNEHLQLFIFNNQQTFHVLVSEINSMSWQHKIEFNVHLVINNLFLHAITYKHMNNFLNSYLLSYTNNIQYIIHILFLIWQHLIKRSFWRLFYKAAL